MLTSSNDRLEWENSHRLANVDAVKMLKASEGADLLIQGSSTLYPQLLNANLIDRLMVMTFPVILGKGKRLFGHGITASGMTLMSIDVSTTGVVIATYEPAGTIPIGTFELPNPSAAELQRRERMARDV